MEALGRPTVVLATQKFEALARQSAAQCGLEDARIVSVQHPVGGVKRAVVEGYADAVVAEVMDRLLHTGAH